MLFSLQCPSLSRLDSLISLLVRILDIYIYILICFLSVTSSFVSFQVFSPSLLESRVFLPNGKDVLVKRS